MKDHWNTRMFHRWETEFYASYKAVNFFACIYTQYMSAPQDQWRPARSSPFSRNPVTRSISEDFGAHDQKFFFNQTDKIKNLSIRKLLRLALKQSQMQTPLRRICTTASIKDLVNADKFFVNSNEHSYLRDLVGSRRRTAVELCAHLPHDPWNYAHRNERDLQNDAHGRHDCRESVLPCPPLRWNKMR